MKNRLLIITTIVAALVLSGCAPSPDISECLTAEQYGFWSGLWHGIIAPAGFILSLFFEDIAMYAVNNNGGWYDFGFVLGAGILFGGSGKASK